MFEASSIALDLLGPGASSIFDSLEVDPVVDAEVLDSNVVGDTAASTKLDQTPSIDLNAIVVDLSDNS